MKSTISTVFFIVYGLAVIIFIVFNSFGAIAILSIIFIIGVVLDNFGPDKRAILYSFPTLVGIGMIGMTVADYGRNRLSDLALIGGPILIGVSLVLLFLYFKEQEQQKGE